jgi:hypothetical protein
VLHKRCVTAARIYLFANVAYYCCFTATCDWHTLLLQHNVAFISAQTVNSVTNYFATQLTQGGTGPGVRPLWAKGITGLGEVR